MMYALSFLSTECWFFPAQGYAGERKQEKLLAA